MEVMNVNYICWLHPKCVPMFLYLTDLMTLGGLQLCTSQYLCHAQSGLRWRAAQLIASSAQNMPEVQVHLFTIGALPKLLQLTDSDPDPTVRVKALYAVSCEYLKTELQKLTTAHIA